MVSSNRTTRALREWDALGPVRGAFSIKTHNVAIQDIGIQSIDCRAEAIAWIVDRGICDGFADPTTHPSDAYRHRTKSGCLTILW